MATLTNPINAQNIIDRFADYVVATANASIVWYNNGPGAIAEPFAEFNQDLLGGSGGLTIGINGAGTAGTAINATTIYNVLRDETARYTRIRNLRARLLITAPAGAGNATRAATDAKDLTAKAHLSAAYQANIGSPANSNVASGQRITAVNLEGLFNNLRTAYTTARDATVQIDVSVCHSSCHTSCHSSRGRR